MLDSGALVAESPDIGHMSSALVLNWQFVSNKLMWQRKLHEHSAVLVL